MNTITLLLKAKHFKHTNYIGWGKGDYCAIEKAAIEQFKPDIVSEQVYNVVIDDILYRHEIYDELDFSSDGEEAKKHNYDETIIKEIELTPA